MMTWNYRVFREEDGDYVIREVFYAEDGAIVGCTADAVEPFGSTLEELAQSIEDFKAALTERLVETLTPIQQRYNELINDPSELERILKQGADEVRPTAEATVQQVKKAIGLG